MDIFKTYTSKHSPQKLFQAWISPEIIISPVSKIEVIPKVGGDYVLHAPSEQDVFVMRGRFIEFVPNKKLKYSWHWEGTEETTTVAVKFVSHKGESTIEINHTGFMIKESKDNHASGWDHYVMELEKRLNN